MNYNHGNYNVEERGSNTNKKFAKKTLTARFEKSFLKEMSSTRAVFTRLVDGCIGSAGILIENSLRGKRK